MPARQRDNIQAADLPGGEFPSQQELLEWLQADAITLRDACQRVRNRWAFIVLLGDTHVESETFRMFNLMSTVAGVYFGSEAQPAAFPFDQALGAARRGL
jgi:hypothetical protein